MYKHLDTLLVKAKERIRTEYGRIGVMGFDALNVSGTKKVTGAMFDRLLDANETLYLKAAKQAYKTAAEGEEKTEINEEWLSGILAGFSLVTGYLYTREAERKRLRLNEMILTAREFDSRPMLTEGIRRGANLWWTQTSQYGIEVVDSATLRAYRDRGVKRVKWITVQDERRCPTCGERHNKIYKIDEVPAKTHYNCRCYLIPLDVEE